MADTLLFRGGSTSDVNDGATTVSSREIVIDTDTDEIVSGPSKLRTLMQQANGDVRIGGTNIKLNADGSASFNRAATINSPSTQLILNRPGHSNWNIGNSSAGLFLNQDLQDGNGSKKRLVIAPESGPAAFGIAFSDRNEVETFRVEENGTVKALGIAFGAPSASATGRTLDDYEEGTWTPAFSFATPGDLAVTYSNQTGNYRIVGKLCIATFTLEFTPTYTTSSGTARVTGLPLSTGNYLTTPASVDRFAGFTLTAGFDNMWLRKSTGQTYVELYSMGRSGSPSMGTSEVVSGSAKILNGTIIYNL